MYDQTFYGMGKGRGSGWGGDRDGGNNERCLKWGDGVGIIKESLQKLLKMGMGKGNNCL